MRSRTRTPRSARSSGSVLPSHRPSEASFLLAGHAPAGVPTYGVDDGVAGAGVLGASHADGGGSSIMEPFTAAPGAPRSAILCMTGVSVFKYLAISLPGEVGPSRQTR